MKILYSRICGESGSAAAYALLGRAYRSEYGGTLPKIVKTPNGKPYFPAKPDIHFSLSHSRTHVLCVLSDMPVGADIESPRIVSGRAAKYFGSPEELSDFDPLDLWVLKESCIKLVGGTLLLVKSIHFSYENGKILTPDMSSFSKLPIFSKLYRICGCRAAISSYCSNLPDAIVP